MKNTKYLTGIALLLIGLSIAIAVTLTASQSAHADPGVLYAAPVAVGSGDCSSWADACTLQTALANATDLYNYLPLLNCDRCGWMEFTTKRTQRFLFLCALAVFQKGRYQLHRWKN